MIVLSLLAGLLGLLLGSFANVVVYRVPAGASIVSPPSACPACGARIQPWQNVPIMSWLALRAKCASCKEPISIRYPLVELLTGLAFSSIVAWQGLQAFTAVLLYLAFITIVLSAIDLDVRRLPDRIVGPSAVVVGVGLLAVAWIEGEWGDLARAGIGAVALGAFYFAVVMIYPKGMGLGDVKLAPILGAVLAYAGWSEFAVGAFGAFVWGGIVGIVAVVASRKLKGVAIPFGPWMFAGAWTGLVVGAPVVDWYLEVALGRT